MKFIGSSLCAVVLLAATSATAGTVDLTGLVNSDLVFNYTNGTMYPTNGGPLTVGGIRLSACNAWQWEHGCHRRC
jgi:hypothetical protein